MTGSSGEAARIPRGHTEPRVSVVRAGSDKRGVGITVKLDDGKKHVLGMRAEPQRLRTRVRRDGKHVWTDRTLPDAG